MNKYRNTKVFYDGRTFDSKAECNRYKELRLLEEAGLIHSLECQVTYILLPGFTDNQGNRERAITYTPDFYYIEGGCPVVEDVKGVRTVDYVMKRKFFKHFYPHIKFEEVKA